MSDDQHNEVTEAEVAPSELTTMDTTADRGASIVEYALLVALIAVVCIGAVTFFGEATSNSYSSSTSSLFASS